MKYALLFLLAACQPAEADRECRAAAQRLESNTKDLNTQATAGHVKFKLLLDLQMDAIHVRHCIWHLTGMKE